MDTEEPPLAERKQRKSVVFNTEQLVIEPDGKVTTTMSSPEEPKEASAQSHTPPPVEDTPAAEDGGLDLTKKKKKKKPKTEDADGEAAEGTAEDGGLDLSMKKKKKKKVKDAAAEDDFAAKLKALDLEGGEEGGEDAAAVQEEEDVDAGDMDKGTGIWAHDEKKAISYDLLLSRFFNLLSQKNPEHASSGSRSYKIPPPQCMREGNKKTIFANIPEICKRMKRTEEHVTAYLFAELGTSGSVDGSRRLVIKGRFQQKQIENVLRKYIMEYVTCKTCRSPDTELNKGENRLYFITCNSCGSRRSVTAIKTGFSAQVGKRKKMLK